MAVAGLHNVSEFGSSFFGESQRRWDDGHDKPSTRASSLLQMWREIEGDHVVSQSNKSKLQRNGSDSECVSTCTSVGNGSENGDDFSQVSDESENRGFGGSETEHDDNNSVISEQSSDLGEIERERVRQIFREWMNTGSQSHSSYGFHLNKRSEQLLGENERERVRIVREWTQITTQQRNNCRSSRDVVAEVGSQIEQVRDGLVITHPKVGERRSIRRLCGRQTLLDLLQKAQNERKIELLQLSEQRPVSEFAHRNRIQALLRGRFLRNERLVLDERPSSVASTELVLLRQKYTVSDLREGFLSKLENSSSVLATSAESDSPVGDGNNCESEITCSGSEVTDTHIASDFETCINRDRNSQKLEVTEDTVLLNEKSEQEMSLGAGGASTSKDPVFYRGVRQHEAYSVVELGTQTNANMSDELSLESVEINMSGPDEVYDESYQPRSGVSDVREVDRHSTNLERNTNEELYSHDASAQVEDFQESIHEMEHGQQLNTIAFAEWADSRREDVDRSLRERGYSQSFPEPSDNNGEEQDQMHESHDWPSHDLQEAIDSWLDTPSGEVEMSVGRLDAFDFPDDDNVEIRELLSRRRVSGLLRSGFRESLDQVLQSHVERLVHASDDWELENTSFPVIIEQNQEQINDNQTLDPPNNTEITSFAPPSSNDDVSHLVWDEDLQGANWPHFNSNQQLETEWEIIDELRIDMARLHQRMNDMQNMLETCMDMQLELQRSVRQEVSAALNRPIFSRDTSEDNRIHDESQWDHVRKGICCLCQNSKIDSLLYRCGHMCACTKCSESLVRSKGKCPMCHAPAVEAVRAYFTQ